jgi:hypothetical protein
VKSFKACLAAALIIASRQQAVVPVPGRTWNRMLCVARACHDRWMLRIRKRRSICEITLLTISRAARPQYSTEDHRVPSVGGSIRRSHRLRRDRETTSATRADRAGRSRQAHRRNAAAFTDAAAFCFYSFGMATTHDTRMRSHAMHEKTRISMRSQRHGNRWKYLMENAFLRRGTRIKSKMFYSWPIGVLRNIRSVRWLRQ